MTKHIGIVACSAEGAALCYTTICLEAQSMMGEHRHPEVTMHTYSLGEYMDHVRAGRWDRVGELMLASVRKVAGAGAELAVCPDNTIHQGLPFIRERSPIPFIHIAESVAAEARSKGYRTLGVTGTKYLMTSDVYPRALDAEGIGHRIPPADQRETIDGIIFRELVNGVFTPASRAYFNQVFDGLKQQGCDAAVMGCTEIPLLVDPSDTPLPVLDSTRLLARSALRQAIA